LLIVLGRKSTHLMLQWSYISNFLSLPTMTYTYLYRYMAHWLLHRALFNKLSSGVNSRYSHWNLNCFNHPLKSSWVFIDRQNSAFSKCNRNGIILNLKSRFIRSTQMSSDSWIREKSCR
jgi:hypothetical protein